MATKTKTIYGPKPTEVSVTSKQTSGTNIATITVNGTATELYAPNGGSGGGSDLPVGVFVRCNGFLELTEDEYNSLHSSPVGTLKNLSDKTLNFLIPKTEVLASATDSTATAYAPVTIEFGTPGEQSYGTGMMSLNAIKMNDAYINSGDIRVDTLVRYKQSNTDIKYLFGLVILNLTNIPITYNESSHTFTINDTNFEQSSYTFTLYNSIESGGSGSSAGVSDVDWTGQYNADNGVELGTLTITTTD